MTSNHFDGIIEEPSRLQILYKLNEVGSNDGDRSNVDASSRTVVSLIVIAEETIDTIIDATRTEVT